MANITDYEEFKSLIVREQFLHQCSKDLAVHRKERVYRSMAELCNQADRYLEARGQTLSSTVNASTHSDKGQEKDIAPGRRHHRECYKCGRLGHTRAECRMQGGGSEQQCTNCNILGHNTDLCRNQKTVAGVIQMKTNTASSRKSANDGTQLMPYEGLKTVKGKVGNRVLNTLRDTGCNTICLRRKFVRGDQMTGKQKTCKLMDGSERTLQTAVVDIDTPYLKKRGATVVSLDLEDTKYNLVIGNVRGARCMCLNSGMEP